MSCAPACAILDATACAALTRAVSPAGAREEGGSGLYVSVFTYRARVGEEDAVVALHEDWQRNHRPTAGGFVAGEVLRAHDDPRTFIDVVHFVSEEAARIVARDPDQDAWYRRLVSLCEAEPVFTDCQIAWQGQ